MRNGRHQAREVLTSSGAIEVVAPRVNAMRVDPAGCSGVVLLDHPAAVVTQVVLDPRGPVAAIHARAVLDGLRPRVEAVPSWRAAPAAERSHAPTLHAAPAPATEPSEVVKLSV